MHFCLGAPLARMEGEIALNTLLRRLPAIELAAPVDELEYRPVPLFHSYTHIPVNWSKKIPATEVRDHKGMRI